MVKEQRTREELDEYLKSISKPDVSKELNDKILSLGFTKIHPNIYASQNTGKGYYLELSIGSKDYFSLYEAIYLTTHDVPVFKGWAYNDFEDIKFILERCSHRADLKDHLNDSFNPINIEG